MADGDSLPVFALAFACLQVLSGFLSGFRLVPLLQIPSIVGVQVNVPATFLVGALQTLLDVVKEARLVRFCASNRWLCEL